MKNRKIIASPKSQQAGFSLVELLIAGVLGLLLIGGVIQLFLGSNQNFTMQDEMANIQESGRLALMVLKEDVEKGGYSSLGVNAPSAIDVAQSSDGSSDSIAVRYFDVGAADCNGVVSPTGEIVNRYFVQDNQLMCQGNGGGTPQPLVEGVEMFQVLYGTDENICPNASVKSYINISDVVANGLDENIFAVRVGILLKSDDEVKPKAESDTFQVLNVSHSTPNDKFAYRLFQQTIYMPNTTFNRLNDQLRPVCPNT